MALPAGDAAVGHYFQFTFDGVQCPSVTDITGLKLEVDKVEAKSITNDGKYIISQMPGRMKPGEFTVTRVLDGDKTLYGWFDSVAKAGAANIVSARHTASIKICDVTGATIKTYDFSNCWCVSIETNEYKAGSTDAMTEKATITWTEATVS
ncbi:MAG: phage tail protein [Acidimicrobiales bacterium]